jgi:opacity protein-like surface antigen
MRPFLPLAPLLFACAGSLHAQGSAGLSIAYPESDPMSVAITARAGVTMATPRGTFPSLIIGESRRSTGSIGQQYGRSEVGHRVDVAALIPFIEDIGVSLAFGSQRSAVSYPADTLRQATRFDVQALHGSIGVQWSALHRLETYEHYGGLRSIYIDAGLDVGLVTTANLIEGTTFDDTLGGGAKTTEGSFESNDPFRSTVALRGGVGIRFAATPNIEIVLESSYSHALNEVFSSEAIEGNDFTLDVLRAVLGVGYRF